MTAPEPDSALDPDMALAPDMAPVRGRSRRVWWPITLAAVFAALLVAVLGAAVRRPGLGPEVGRTAPHFALVTFDGPVIALDDLRGKVVVVNFWASWCVPCADEADDLELVWQRYKDRDVQFLGVNFVDTEGPARAYLSRHAVSYPNGPDLGGRISQRYRVTGVPETFVIDRDGVIVSLAPDGSAPVARLQAPLTPSAAFAPMHLVALIDRLIGSEAGDGKRNTRRYAGMRP